MKIKILSPVLEERIVSHSISKRRFLHIFFYCKEIIGKKGTHNKLHLGKQPYRPQGKHKAFLLYGQARGSLNDLILWMI